jgi:hypothetical protein
MTDRETAAAVDALTRRLRNRDPHTDDEVFALEFITALRDLGGDETAMGDGTGGAVPGLACPGCGSPDVDLRRGLLCGTCAETAAGEGDGDG